MKRNGKLFKLIAMIISICTVIICFSGCKDNNKQTGSTVTLKWYLPCIETEGRSEVQNEINKILEKDGISVELIYIDQGNYSSKLQVLNAGNEEYDLCYTSNWLNDFYKNVSGGVFCDITELVPKYAPTLYASMKKEVWDAIKCDGKLYSVPNWQIQTKGAAMIAPTKNYEAAGVDPDSIHNMKDVDNYLRKLHKADPTADLYSTYWDILIQYYGLLPVGNLKLPGAVYYKGDDWSKVVNQYETPEFEEYVKTVRNWVEEGLLHKEYLVGADRTNKVNSGLNSEAMRFATDSPFAASQFAVSRNEDWSISHLGERVLSTDGINCAMTGVSATSKHPEEAVKLLEIVNTTPEIINLICYGVEGKDYKKISDKKIEMISDSNYTGPSYFYVGSAANTLVPSQYSDDVWEKTKEFNENADISPILGFVPNTDAVAGEIANCQTVINEQLEMLTMGYVPADEGLKKLRESLEKAGAPRIIKEYQRQLDDWKAKNGK